MAILRGSIEVHRPVEETFEAVADFSNSEAWDPGVLRAAQVQKGAEEAIGVGAAYDLVVTFRGREREMRYRTTRFGRPDLVRLEGEGSLVRAVDTIEFERIDDGGTRITYTADLRLKGIGRLAEPFLRRAFDELGERALEGMKSWLEADSA